MIVPVRIPGSASGPRDGRSSHLRRADTERRIADRDGGTDLIALRPAMTMTGNTVGLRGHGIRPTRGAERGRFMKLRNTARPRSLKMIDGTAARLLIDTSIASVQRFRGATLKVDGRKHPDRERQQDRDEDCQEASLGARPRCPPLRRNLVESEAVRKLALNVRRRASRCLSSATICSAGLSGLALRG